MGLRGIDKTLQNIIKEMTPTSEASHVLHVKKV